jgi:hypothetical protein
MPFRAHSSNDDADGKSSIYFPERVVDESDLTSKLSAGMTSIQASAGFMVGGNTDWPLQVLIRLGHSLVTWPLAKRQSSWLAIIMEYHHGMSSWHIIIHHHGTSPWHIIMAHHHDTPSSSQRATTTLSPLM